MAGQGWVPGQAQGAWGVHAWNQSSRSNSSQSWGTWGTNSQYGQGGYTHAGIQQWGQRGGWGAWQSHSHGSGQGGLWQGVPQGQASHSHGRGAGWAGDGARSHDFSQSTSTQGLKTGHGARVGLVGISFVTPSWASRLCQKRFFFSEISFLLGQGIPPPPISIHSQFLYNGLVTGD